MSRYRQRERAKRDRNSHSDLALLWLLRPAGASYRVKRVGFALNPALLKRYQDFTATALQQGHKEVEAFVFQ